MARTRCAQLKYSKLVDACSVIPRLLRSSEGLCAQSRGQAKNGIGQLVRFRMKLPFSVQVYTEK